LARPRLSAAFYTIAKNNTSIFGAMRSRKSSASILPLMGFTHAHQRIGASLSTRAAKIDSKLVVDNKGLYWQCALLEISTRAAKTFE